MINAFAMLAGSGGAPRAAIAMGKQDRKGAQKILGTVFVMIVMGFNPFITTQGFAKFSMITTVVGAVCNIILDPILILYLDWGSGGLR